MNAETGSTSDRPPKSGSVAAFRCLNCFARNSPPPAAKVYRCPQCGFEWRVSWVAPDMPRIRGPVWDVNRRLAEEANSSKAE